VYDAAVRAARAADYTNVGTVEFLVDPKTNEFWFMEVNTRLQVEHTVTEELTNVDIVREQILIAEGAALDIAAEKFPMAGRAIQVRINAEDPLNNFSPTGERSLSPTSRPAGQASGLTASSTRDTGYRWSTIRSSSK